MSDTAADAAERRSAKKKTAERGPGFVARVRRFVREVVAELRLVVRPTRNEVVNYTTTVLVFVAIIMAFVLLVDYAAGKLTFFVFGG